MIPIPVEPLLINTHEDLARDLIARTETALKTVARLAVDTGITFSITDVVDAVERDLPAGYPAPAEVVTGRRGIITRMTQDLLSGEMYADA